MDARAKTAAEGAGEALRAEPRAALSAAQATALLARTRLLALDVDGVLTDGRIMYGAGGPAEELQCFNVQDGLALVWLVRAGIAVVLITGRGCAATEHRARELGIVEVHQKCASKHAVLREIQERRGIAPAETVAMGDDLPDLGLRARAQFFAAPANARPELKQRADLVTQAGGGAGAVRELCEHILRAQGRWQALLDAAAR